MPDTKYESQEVSNSYPEPVVGSRWWGQTFTPDTNHDITSVDLRLTSYGQTEGTETFVVEIYGVDVGRKPTGSAKVSGTLTKDQVNTSSAGDWLNIVLTGASPLLVASTEYAIVIRAQDEGSASYIHWLRQFSDVYADGNLLLTTNSGSSWTRYTNQDYTFKEYGTLPDELAVGEATATASMTGLAITATVLAIGSVTATATMTGVTISTNLIVGSLTAIASMLGLLSSQSSGSLLVPNRRDDYDPDKFWDEETKAWVASQPIEKLAGGWHKTYLVVVSDQNLVYVGGL